MHCYTKLKKYEKWRQTRIALRKAAEAEGVVDLDAPVATSAGRPIDNKKAKAVVNDAASSDRVLSAMDKCLSDVSSNMASRAEKSDQRWKSLLSKQDEKIELEKARVAVMKKEGGLQDLDRRHFEHGR